MIRARWQGEGKCDILIGRHADERAQRSFIRLGILLSIESWAFPLVVVEL